VGSSVADDDEYLCLFYYVDGLARFSNFLCLTLLQFYRQEYQLGIF
jgi:hypothetical protein